MYGQLDRSWALQSLVGIALITFGGLAACGEDTTTEPPPPPVTDTTPPTVAISDDISGTSASGDVTFTFTFSEDIAASFAADRIEVTSGTAGTFEKATAKRFTLVVTPPSDETGTLRVALAVGSFADLAGNLNSVAASASQAFDTRQGQKTQMNLPVTFDDANVDYGLLGFGGAEDSTIVADPAGGTNQVAKVVKADAAELWAGTTLTADGTAGFATRIPIDAANTRLTVRVYSPDADIPVRLKVEDSTDPTISVETEARTTAANTWETLTFELAQQAPGTAALQVARTYDKASIFFNFGVDGATAGEKTYHFDDVVFIGGTTQVPGTDFETLTFDDATVTYALTGFGGAEDSTVVDDPTDATNRVARVLKADMAELWAGTTVSTGINDSVPMLPFDADNTRMTVRVYSPDAGIQVRLKVENAGDPTISVETEATTTMANAWETLTFEMARPAAGTASINFANTYDKVSVFFNFGVTGAVAGEKIYFFDDVAFIGGTTGGGMTGMFETITFDDAAVTYALTGFGGAEDATVQADPAGGTNQVARVLKADMAELWAGTTVSTGPNFSVPRIPLANGNTRMTVRVYSPHSGIAVRLKVENANDPTVSVETEAMVTMVNAWQTLTFDFANEAPGTAAFNQASTYDKVSIFFNFGTTGAMAGARTYYFDDVAFVR